MRDTGEAKKYIILLDSELKTLYLIHCNKKKKNNIQLRFLNKAEGVQLKLCLGCELVKGKTNRQKH